MRPSVLPHSPRTSDLGHPQLGCWPSRCAGRIPWPCWPKVRAQHVPHTQCWPGRAPCITANTGAVQGAASRTGEAVNSGLLQAQCL